MIPGIKNLSCKERLRKLNLHSLESRRVRDDGSLQVNQRAK